MRSEWIKKAAAALLAALLLELIPYQFSFWTTVTKKTEDLTARAEILAGYTAIEELDQDVANGAAATPGDQTTEGGSALYLLDGSYLDDAGYLHVPDGSLTLRVKNYKGSLQRIFLIWIFCTISLFWQRYLHGTRETAILIVWATGKFCCSRFRKIGI